jgi:hypothetical protein
MRKIKFKEGVAKLRVRRFWGLFWPIFALLLPLVALSGCATVYQQEGPFTNGYSDFRSSEDTFVVTFRASEHTPEEKVLQYALERSAELTLQHGFRYFSLLEKVGKGPGLHFPSVRLTIQCSHSESIDREWIDALHVRNT